MAARQNVSQGKLLACSLSLSHSERRSQQVAACWHCGTVVLWYCGSPPTVVSRKQSNKQSAYRLSGVRQAVSQHRDNQIGKYLVIIMVVGGGCVSISSTASGQIV